MILVTFAVLGLNFQKFECEEFFPIRKLLEGRSLSEVGLYSQSRKSVAQGSKKIISKGLYWRKSGIGG